MPYFTGGDPIGPNQSAVLLDDFPSSVGASLQASMGQQWAGNASTLLFDDAKLHHLNDGEPLAREDAQAAVQAAGVKLDIPESGYTRGALDYLIQRRQDEARRADILARAPTGILPGAARFGVQLAAGIADPLNVAASFIPFVGEARIASLLARGGESALGRAGARAAIGAGEGLAGQVPIEALSYPLHQQLQDDYTMADSLTNLAFGAAMGSALHVAGGAAADIMRGGAPHPYQRFQGLSPGEIQDVFNFERERPGMVPEDQARALATYSPATRRAIGMPDVAEPPPHATATPDEPLEYRPPSAAGELVPRTPLSASQTVAALSPDLHEVAARTAIADAVQGRLVDVDAIVGLQPKPADTGPTVDAMVAELQRQRADLLPIAGNLAEKGAIRQTRQELKVHQSQLPKTDDEALRARAKEIQAGGGRVSYKAALSRASKEVAELVADHEATTARLQGIIESNARAQQAVQAVHDIDQRIDALIKQRPLADLRPTTLDDVRSQAQRQAQPERISVADFFAARAEDARLAREQALREATPDAALAAAGEQRSTADEALEAVLRNLEQAGQQIEGLRAQLAEQLAPFDEAVADAKNVGNAVRAAALCGIRT